MMTTGTSLNITGKEYFSTPGKSIVYLHTDMEPTQKSEYFDIRDMFVSPQEETALESLRRKKLLATIAANKAQKKKMLWIAGGSAAVIGVGMLLMMRGKG
tara:strand:+ start:325 stop:624 length:300 start_codon:yes stop_codon:yes gene_type:complete